MKFKQIAGALDVHQVSIAYSECYQQYCWLYSNTRPFYTLYIGPNDNGTSHLLFKLSTKQILTTLKYKPVLIPIPGNIIKAINEKDSFITKIQINHFDSDCFIDQDYHLDNTQVKVKLNVMMWITLKMRVTKNQIAHNSQRYTPRLRGTESVQE